MTSKKKVSEPRSMGIEEFIKEMGPSVNQNYKQWVKKGLPRLEFIDNLTSYVDENGFAFDDKGNIEKGETRNRHMYMVAVLLFIDAVMAAGDAQDALSDILSEYRGPAK